MWSAAFHTEQRHLTVTPQSVVMGAGACLFQEQVLLCSSQGILETTINIIALIIYSNTAHTDKDAHVPAHLGDWLFSRG